MRPSRGSVGAACHLTRPRIASLLRIVSRLTRQMYTASQKKKQSIVLRVHDMWGASWIWAWKGNYKFSYYYFRILIIFLYELLLPLW